MTAARLIASLATALLVVAGLGHLASQTVLRPPEVPTGRPSAYVAAPTPVTRLADQPDGTAAAPTRAAPPRVARIRVGSGIPAAAVRAYATAQLAEPAGCEVGWT